MFLQSGKPHPEKKNYFLFDQRKDFIEQISAIPKIRLERMNYNRKQEVIRHEQQPCTFSSSLSDFLTFLKVKKRNTSVKYLERASKSNENYVEP